MTDDYFFQAMPLNFPTIIHDFCYVAHIMYEYLSEQMHLFTEKQSLSMLKRDDLGKFYNDFFLFSGNIPEHFALYACMTPATFP